MAIAGRSYPNISLIPARTQAAAAAAVPTGGQINVRAAGTLTAKPVTVRAAGVFTTKPLLIRKAGVFVNAT